MDTIKTKMQAQKGFESFTTWKTLKTILKTEGVRGLYRGCIPPLLVLSTISFSSSYDYSLVY